MWQLLSIKQKLQFKEYCEQQYNQKTYAFCETGEPMYFDSQGNLIPTTWIIKLLFIVNLN